jgi:hypothetical protein
VEYMGDQGEFSLVIGGSCILADNDGVSLFYVQI